MAGDDTPGAEEPSDDRGTPAQAVGEDRDRIADVRDDVSEADDQAAEARDARADARDARADARDDRSGGEPGGAFDREEAQRDRRAARQDRRAAGRDRSRATSDRRAARSDRAMAAAERAVSSIDQLTGAYRRDSGVLELQREIAKAKRTGEPFTVVFVDLDGLKATNDTLGHAAGDQLLRHTAEALRANLRSYDVVVRFGGDEFVCGIPEMNQGEAAERFLLVNTKLAETPHASVTVGFAELTADDSLDDLIARADSALYRERHQHRPDQG